MARRLISLLVCMLFPVAFATGSDATKPTTGPDNLRFEGYAEAPAFKVAPRKKKIRRCMRCHKRMDPNPTIRELEEAPHVDGMSHGRGRLWCMVCHDEKDRDYLRTLIGERVDINQGYVICGSCHADRQKDWYFGGHGKRVATWDGERVLYNCNHCHDPHEPAIEARKPEAPPKPRIGLPMMAKPHHETPATGDSLAQQEETPHGE